MHPFRPLLLLFIILLTPSLLSSMVYEDAEDKTTSKWIHIQMSDPGNINNIYDREKRSHVIQFAGEHTRSAYLLAFPKKQIANNQHTLSWEMKYFEDFVIMVQLSTSTGKHTLIYTPGTNDSHLQYALGESSTLGLWNKYQRNLAKDLHHFYSNSNILSVDSFVIKGNGVLDNIVLGEANKNIQKIEAPKVTKAIVPKKPSEKANRLPKIHLKGDNPLFLRKGEHYHEEGATAFDSDGEALSIEISHQINILEEGEYSVLYIATNKLGNSGVDRRRVIVGEIQKRKVDLEAMEEEQASLKAEKTEKERSEWERKLELHENKLTEQKKLNQETMRATPKKYPSRPGL